MTGSHGGQVGTDAPAQGLEGRVVAGRYRVERLLGEGGMGCVYQAEHIHMRKTIALKVLHREMTLIPEAVARFEREAIAAGRIEHKNVVNATDFGRLEDGSFYLVLEFVRGRSLREVLGAAGALHPTRALEIAAQMARALEAAHAAGIVHRDLKPENVMLLERNGDTDFVKVLDFGIAKLSAPEIGDQPALTRLGAVFGTPEYMSPEQAAGRPADARSDLYALGTILYEMLVGHVPFRSDNTVGVLSQQLTATPAPLGSAVDPEVSTIVRELLAKQPHERPASASELVTRLEQLRSAHRATHVSGAALSQRPALARTVAWWRAAARFSVPALRQARAAAQRLARATIARFTPLLRRTLRIGGLELRGWHLLALGSVLGLIQVLVLAPARAPDAQEQLQPDGSAASSQPLAARPLSPPSRSTPGHPEAHHLVRRVESIPVYKRSYDDWLALARAHAALGAHRESAIAYRAVLSVRGSARNDPVLLKDLHRAGQELSSHKLVINLCETKLRKVGMDLLYDLWLATRSRPDRQPIAQVVRRKLEILRRRASPALRTTLELEVAKSCESIRKHVERAIENGDRRSVPRLTELTRVTGCGTNGQEDCYPCLRTDQTLAEAIARASSRPAPALFARDP